MSFIRHLRRERVHEEMDDHPPRRWERFSRYRRVRVGWGLRLPMQTVWGADSPITRKGRRDLWVVSGIIFTLTVALLAWSVYA